MSIVENATMKAVKYLTDEGIYDCVEQVSNRIRNWFAVGGVKNIEALAALGMSLDYERDMTSGEIECIRQFYFPNDSYAIENVLF